MDETTALLARHHSPPPLAHVAVARRPRPRTVVFLVSLFVFFLSCCDGLAAVPTTRLLEDAICRRYSVRDAAAAAPIDEAACKTDAIQSELAYLKGLMDAIEAAICLLAALPYGALCDRIGRRLVLLLFVAGYFLYSLYIALVIYYADVVPLRAILMSPAFFLIGGGRCVIVSAVHSAVADVTTDVQRASGFLAIMAGSLVGDFVGPVVSSALMSVTSAWCPYLLSLGVMLLGAAVLLLMPETSAPPKAAPEPLDDDKDASTAVGCRLRNCLAQFRDSLDLLRRPGLAVLLLTFLAPMPTQLATGQFFVQYVSKRFRWSLAAAGYLLSLRGAVNMLLLLLLPALSALVLARASAPAADRALALASAAALALGCLLMAGGAMPVVVAGLVVSTLGAAIAALCRSLAAHLVSPRHTAKVQTLTSMVEAVGSLVAGPALAALLSAGMARRGACMGLPYLALALFLLLTTLVPLFFVRVAPRPAADDDDVDVDVGPAPVCARPLDCRCAAHALLGADAA